MSIITEIMSANMTIPKHDRESIYEMAGMLPQADHGGCLELGDAGLATSLAIVIIAGLESLDEVEACNE